MPVRGTLPWTTATVTVATIEVPSGIAHPLSIRTMHADTASTRAGTHASPGCQAARTATSSRAPARTSRNPSSGTPPIDAQAAVGASAWEWPRRPHGNPPKGTRPRSASTATHQQATQNGQPGQPQQQRGAGAEERR